MIQTPKENKSNQEQSSETNTNSNSSKIIGKAQNIVNMAVDVLEEEIAAGILAAKELEKKILDVDEVRNVNPNELIPRLRKDAHDVVDLMLDAIAAVTQKLGNLSDNLVNIPESKPTSKSVNQVPILKNEEPVVPGSEITIPILLGNDDPQQNKTIRLIKVDMLGPSDSRIEAKQIHLSPEFVDLLPSEKKEMHIKINVPSSTTPGTYSALFQDAKMANVRAVIEVEVK